MGGGRTPPRRAWSATRRALKFPQFGGRSDRAASTTTHAVKSKSAALKPWGSCIRACSPRGCGAPTMSRSTSAKAPTRRCSTKPSAASRLDVFADVRRTHLQATVSAGGAREYHAVRPPRHLRRKRALAAWRGTAIGPRSPNATLSPTWKRALPRANCGDAERGRPAWLPGALGLDLDDFGAAGFLAAAPTAPRPTRNRSGRILGSAYGRAPGERA